MINRRLFGENQNNLFTCLAEFDENVGLNFVTPQELIRIELKIIMKMSRFNENISQDIERL